MNSFKKSLLMTIAAIVLFLRKHECFYFPYLHAEDGAVFLIQAFRDGPSAFFTEYAGYFHLVPRIGALLGSLLPIALIPTGFLLFATSVVFASFYLIVSSPIGRRHKFLLVLLMIFVPNTGEVFFNLTNTIWLCGLSLFILLNNSEPQTSRGKLFTYCFLPILSLSGVFSVFLSPLYLIKAFLTPSAFRIRSALLVVSCAAIQVFSILRSPVSDGRQDYNILDWLNVLTGRTILRVFFNNLWFPWDMRDWAGAFLLLLVFLGFMFYFAIKYKNFVLFSANSFFVALIFGVSFRLSSSQVLSRNINADRYFIIPCLLIGILLVESLGLAKGRITRTLIMFFCLIYIATGIKYFNFERYPRTYWVERSTCVGGSHPCSVSIFPENFYFQYDPQFKYIWPWQRH